MEDSKMNGAPVANDGGEVRVKEEAGAHLSKKTSRSHTPSSAQSPAHLEMRASSVSNTDVERPKLSPKQATTSTDLPQLEDSPSSPIKNIKSRASSTSSGDAQRPRLSRKTSRAMSPPEQRKSPSPSASGADAHKPSLKRLKRRVALYDDLPDVTAEACNTFQVIPDCLYGSKNMGSTENDALDCECRDEWHDGVNHACGEDSDCINRATKMECVVGVGNHSDGCQNQRFQRKQYADVSVIKTEKKGHGLRSNGELQAHDFIFEYIGEVINEPTFRRRMMQYDEEGIKHFYFMSLTKSEFVDATKKGNLGRFCNHSCTPNCYVDKWVIGDKLRMGIFASRQIRAGEELVFNYNVDRYGADPQPCYCGEPNCTGFIGGKTQTERATKLPAATVEALGIDDGDSWDTTVAKKPRKKKPDEDDEEYVNSIQPRGLDEDDARKVMATLMQCKEKWIAVKLLERIQRCDDTIVITCLMRMHGYQIMKTVLNTFFDDNNVVLQVLHILDKFPRLTRNKIQDSKIETVVEQLANRGDHEEVAAESQRLLQEWSKLEMGYRIKRRKADSNAPAATNSFEERRNMDRAEPKANQDPLLGADVPKGPRSTVPQRNANYFAGARPFRGPGKKFQGSLPAGWFVARDQSGSQYFYDKNGNTTWQRPTQPAPEPPKFAEQARQKEQLLLRVIESVTNQPKTPQSSSTRTPQTSEPPAKDDRKEKKEKWQSLPLEKQKKVFTNTVHPHIRTAIDRYQKHLSRDEYKYHFKEITKLIVANEYKLDRVGDPARLSHDRAKKLRGKVREYMDKYLSKRKKKNAREEGGKAAPDEEEGGDANVAEQNADDHEDIPMENGADDDVVLSDVETGSTSSRERKRKRDDDDADAERIPGAPREVSETPSAKRIKDDVEAAPPPPPPPPPPGAIPSGASGLPFTEEEEALREQEEALMRENEEAERMEAAERDMSAKGDLSIEKERRILNGEHPSNGGVILSGDGSAGGKEGGAHHDKGSET